MYALLFSVFDFLALVEQTLIARWIFSNTQHNYVVSQWLKLRSFPIWSPSNVIALPLLYCCTFSTKLMSGRASIWIIFSLLLTYFCFFLCGVCFCFLLKLFFSAWCNLPQYVKHLIFVFLHFFGCIFQQCKILALFVTGKAVDWMDLPVLNLLDVIFKWIFIKRKNVLIANLSCGFNGNNNGPFLNGNRVYLMC